MILRLRCMSAPPKPQAAELVTSRRPQERPSRVVLVVAVPCAPHASRYCASSTTPCFFLPAESLISLAASKLAVEMSNAASSILTSLSLAPPPATSRRTSDLLFPSSSDTNKSTTGTPAAASSAESFTRLSDAVPPPPPPPAAKSDAAVAWISARHACVAMAVTRTGRVCETCAWPRRRTRLAVQHAGRLVGKDHLGVVDLRTAQRLELLNLVLR
mmetsp:Transcript_11590/g.38652  ORF Transcript_11590/g.38652 Transcript_11590/m.38652 type:complete len:215 (+) Transcript_11590:34-678(+)